MTWTLVADEYQGDGDKTVYTDYAKASPLILQKAGEGLGGYSWYAPHAAKAKAAGLTCGAYFWVLMREDPTAQLKSFLATAPNADCYAVDLEQGPNPGSHAWNGDASKTTVLRVMHEFFGTFAALKPDKPLLLYGASLMNNLHITWDELIEARDWISAWLPRYAGSGDIRGWDANAILSYAKGSPGTYRQSVPAARIAAVQFTNGTSGPLPHTLPGLNRNEDISVLLVPVEQLTGDDMAILTEDEQYQLRGLLRRLHKAGPPDDAAPNAVKAGFKASDESFDEALKSPAPVPGPTGPRGPRGPSGPQGPRGTSAVLAPNTELVVKSTTT